MIEVIGIKFRTAGKVYYFAPKGLSFTRGEFAVVETSRGVEYGEVLMANKELPEEKIVMPLKEILRKATEEDSKQYEINREKEREAYRICRKQREGSVLLYCRRQGRFSCFGKGFGGYFPYQNRASTGRGKG